MSNDLPKALNISVSKIAHANCPYCSGINYFNDVDHPGLFSEGGEVRCDDYLSCGEWFYIELKGEK